MQSGGSRRPAEAGKVSPGAAQASRPPGLLRKPAHSPNLLQQCRRSLVRRLLAREIHRSVEEVRAQRRHSGCPHVPSRQRRISVKRSPQLGALQLPPPCTFLGPLEPLVPESVALARAAPPTVPSETFGQKSARFAGNPGRQTVKRPVSVTVSNEIFGGQAEALVAARAVRVMDSS